MPLRPREEGVSLAAWPFVHSNHDVGHDLTRHRDRVVGAVIIDEHHFVHPTRDERQNVLEVLCLVEARDQRGHRVAAQPRLRTVGRGLVGTGCHLSPEVGSRRSGSWTRGE